MNELTIVVGEVSTDPKSGAWLVNGQNAHAIIGVLLDLLSHFKGRNVAIQLVPDAIPLSRRVVIEQIEEFKKSGLGVMPPQPTFNEAATEPSLIRDASSNALQWLHSALEELYKLREKKLTEYSTEANPFSAFTESFAVTSGFSDPIQYAWFLMQKHDDCLAAMCQDVETFENRGALTKFKEVIFDSIIYRLIMLEMQEKGLR